MNLINDFSFGVIPVKKNSQDEWLWLLVRHNEGHWGFPKGHKESGEDDLQAAQREFQEETGLQKFQIFPDVFWEETYNFSQNGQKHHKKVKYFLAQVEEGEEGNVNIQKEELQDYRWLKYYDALKLLTYPQSRQILRKAYRLIVTIN